jgi:hypothetical protein
MELEQLINDYYSVMDREWELEADILVWQNEALYYIAFDLAEQMWFEHER